MYRLLVALASSLLLVVSSGAESRPAAGSALEIQTESTGGRPLAALPGGGSWREAREYLTLFTAIGAHPGAYATFVSPLDLDAALRQLAATTGLLRPPGAMTPQSVPASDAFGRDGTADHWALARLYGARRPRVARAPRAEDGRVVESWTLVSPYPDATLTRLESGTLLIILRVP